MLAPDRNITVKAPAELFVQADSGLLNQVIENLLSNAIKFGDAGSAIGIEIGIRDERVYLTVENAGPTICEQDSEKIFERFYRVDESRSRDIEGTGLGLSLAREIARAHGGELSFEQQSNGIVSFVLLLKKTSCSLV
jgi:two-component system heavy metal sensor histidine kinase CusS